MDPITTVEKLDIERFMGDWYVLADIATPFDKDAYAPTEHYVLKSDGMVETIYRYQKGNASGDFKSGLEVAGSIPFLVTVYGFHHPVRFKNVVLRGGISIFIEGRSNVRKDIPIPHKALNIQLFNCSNWVHGPRPLTTM